MSETHAETKVRNKGQFQKGNPGGPGNPHAKQVARIRATLLAALEPETLYQIVCHLIERAVRGNLEAIKILLAYAVGRPGKSDNLIELLTEHYPPLDAEPSRHQTDQTDAQPVGQVADLPIAPANVTPFTDASRQQTDQTDAQPVGQVADLPKAPANVTPFTDASRQQTDQTVARPVGQVADLPKAPADIAPPTSGRATRPTDASRQQTGQTAETRRHQTDQTARKRRQQTAISARMLTSALGNGRHQTGQSAPEPLELMSLIQDVLASDKSPFAIEPANDISLVR